MTKYRSKCVMCNEWVKIEAGQVEVECPLCGCINMVEWIPRLNKYTYIIVGR